MTRVDLFLLIIMCVLMIVVMILAILTLENHALLSSLSEKTAAQARKIHDLRIDFDIANHKGFKF